MTRWTVEDLKRITKVNQQIRHPLDPPKPPKFGNEKTTWQGMKFDSLRELEKFKQFELERIAGVHRAVIRQVSMPLTGHKRRIRIDFLLVEPDGRIRWVDAKGHADEKWLLKRDLIHQNFGIMIETV
jgi:hypothetical protein